MSRDVLLLHLTNRINEMAIVSKARFRLYCIDSTFALQSCDLHAGFACATPTPCDAVKLGKEIERV